MHDRHGITAVESVLIAATIAVIIFVGFAIYQASQDMVEIEDPVAEETGQTSGEEQGETPDAPVIEDEEDLDQARDSLNDIDFEQQLDSSQLSLESEES